MDTLKVYLPSNACPTLFPDNTASDYRTRFDKAIELDGKWEVGVGSIAYSSHINDKKERAQINFKAFATQVVPINTLYTYTYYTTDKGLWKGFDGVSSPLPERDSSKIESVIHALNEVSVSMVEPNDKYGGQMHAFSFYLNKKTNRVQYDSYDPGIVLQLTSTLGYVLGFGYKTVFSGTKRIVAGSAPRTLKDDMKEGDYLVGYMNTVTQQKKSRINIKRHGEAFKGGEAAFLALWKDKITSQVDIRAEFKKGKLVLHNYRRDVGMTFSPDFAATFAIPHPFFGKGSRWAEVGCVWSDDKSEEEWFIEIYTTELATTEVDKAIYVPTTIFPWRSKTIKGLLNKINMKAKYALQDALKGGYDSTRHHVHFSMNTSSNHCRFTQGHSLVTKISPNLLHLLGFSEEVIINVNVMGTREVDALSNHSRQLHLISNVIQPTAYGKHQRQILCDFLHTQTAEPIMEKRFDPINYHPVARNTIDMIHLQLTDDAYNPVSIEDVNTIVTLYFRKV